MSIELETLRAELLAALKSVEELEAELREGRFADADDLKERLQERFVDLVRALLKEQQSQGSDASGAGVAASPAMEQRFNELAAKWREECQVASSVSRMAMHPAYQQIIGMGPKVVPFLLRDLERKPDHWFWALKAITGADPVPSANRGKLKEMAEAWLLWAREQGYRWQNGS